MDDNIVPIPEESVSKKNKRWGNARSTWRQMSRSQKLTSAFLLFILITLPLSVIVAVKPMRFMFPKGAPISGITLPTSTPRVTIVPTYTPRPTTTSTSKPTTTPKPWTPTPKPTTTPKPWTPTPKPTSTATGKPTVTPKPWTPTPKPTVTPLPTASVPPGNYDPVITTTSLPYGTLNIKYSAYIRGYDKNVNDKLIMTITNLPPGIIQSTCTQYKDINGRNSIRCLITGTPMKAGTFQVRVILKDGRNGYTTKTLPLTINAPSSIRPGP